MVFCTQCGHRNPDVGRFCEKCGKPLTGRSALAPQPPEPVAFYQQVSSPVKSGEKRRFVVGAAVLAGVVLGGGGLAYILMPQSASTGNFARVIEQAFEKNPDLLRNHYCLTNFAYDTNPVYVNTHDSNTQRWLQLLVEAGLYTGPEFITTGGGFFRQTRLRFEKTPEAASFIRGNQLCFAQGVALKSVDSFTPPRQTGELEFSDATVTLALKKPAAWSQTDLARSMNERFAPEFSKTFTLVLQDGKWKLATGDLLSKDASQRSERTPPAATKTEEMGFFARLFSFGKANPILGTWASSVMGVEILRVEFRPDSMSMRAELGLDIIGVGDIDIKDIKVRYKIEDGQVTVYSADGHTSGPVMVLRIIDKNSLSFDEGFEQVKLVRVN